MKHQIEYSPLAIRDLNRVWNEVYAASKSYDTTEKYLDDLMDKVQSKADFPESGIPLYYEDLFTGYYFVVFKAYLSFYRIEGDKMLVDRVLYGASDYLRILRIGTDE